MPTSRSYSSIFFDGKTRLQKYTPVNNFNPQSITKGYLDVLAYELEQIYDNGAYIGRAIDPTRSFGVDLENVGFLVGEKRNDAVIAGDFTTTNFNFYIDTRTNYTVTSMLEQFYTTAEITDLITNGFVTQDVSTSEYSIIIPQGLVVSNDDGTINYTTIESCTLSSNTAAYAGIVAIGSGPNNNVETNVLLKHKIFEIPELRKIARFIKCTNNYPIQNGSYSQSDDQLRYSIATKGSAFQGNEISIRRAILKVPGVRDILYEKNKYGAGTIHIIVDAVSPIAADGLIAAVKQVAQAEAAYGEVFFVSRPEYLGVELNFSVKVDATVTDPLSIRNNVRSSIIQYINDLEIGGEIVWNRIIDTAFNTQGVIDFIPNYFKYGTYDSINKVNKQQVVLRFINQQANYTEKWYTDSGLVTCCVA